MRKLALLLVSLVLVGSLVACSTNQGSSSTNDNAATGSNNTETDAANGANNGQPDAPQYKPIEVICSGWTAIGNLVQGDSRVELLLAVEYKNPNNVPLYNNTLTAEIQNANGAVIGTQYFTVAAIEANTTRGDCIGIWLNEQPSTITVTAMPFDQAMLNNTGGGQNYNSQIVVDGDYDDRANPVAIIGTVTNNTGQTLNNVSVIAVYKDAKGDVIGGCFSPTVIETLPSGTPTSFSLLVGQNNAPPRFASFDLFAKLS
ncbi:MAG: FxLYD domain-containing protein [Actinomycetia bacterium]|nr:FxLYD domain-containing protein [Actinomycetes bacterium]